MDKFLIRKWSSFFLVLMLAVSVSMLTGCEGSDGAPGAAGVDGTDGAPGVPSTTGESCVVCHGEDAVVDIAVVHPAPLEKPVVSNIVVARSAGDVLTVTFSVRDAAGDPVTGIGLVAPSSGSDLRVYMADLVPAGIPTVNLPQSTWGNLLPPPGTWPTGFFEIWAEERGSDAGVVISEPAPGDYSFQMVSTAAAIGGPNAPEGDLTDTQRVYVRADARDFGVFDRTMGVADFIMPAAGAAPLPLVNGDTERTIVDASACTACHNDPLQRAAHGGGYQSPQVCNMCHSPIGSFPENVAPRGDPPVYKPLGDVMQAEGFWLARLIHGIHSANDFATSVDFTEVTYPKNIIDCGACHFDAGQDMAANWATNPTQEVCTTCHDVTFGVDATHSGGSMLDNSFCRACHPAVGTGVGMSVTDAHAVTTLKHNPDGSDDDIPIDPNYTATIALSADANADGVYEAGEAILVTVTTSNMAAGDYVIPYAEDVNEVQVAGTRTANVYVYGPRAKAVPVLTPGSTTDPAFDPASGTPDQGRSMRIDSAAGDAQILTDADGFKYQTFAIPADLAAGTYMVMAYVTTNTADCSGIYRGSVCIDGWALTTFNVGTGGDELRVAGPLGGNDATPGCASCHDQADWGTFYHRSYFGTDGCIACHDQSGNHADPIANRVHAIHSACPDCDLLGPVDLWAEVTFPQNIESCEACHTSGNESFINGEPAAWGTACIGCHGDAEGAYDHAIQNGSPITEP